MKKIILALVATLSLASLAVAFDSKGFSVPFSRQATLPNNLTFVGADAASSSTVVASTGWVAVTGAGVLHDVEVSSTAALTAGGYLICTDSATANTTKDVAGGYGDLLFAPMVFGGTAYRVSLTQSADSGKFGGGLIPTEFNNGVNCWCSVAETDIVIKYHLNR